MNLPDLTSDCSKCAALCCVGLALDKGDLFTIDKPAGSPCPNLARDHQCKIHTDLADTGMTGCIQYDCAGAGQRVIHERFNGETWRDDPTLLRAMLRDFSAVKLLHERMAQLVEAENMSLSEPQETERRALLQRHARLWSTTPVLNERFSRFLADLAKIAQD